MGKACRRHAVWLEEAMTRICTVMNKLSGKVRRLVTGGVGGWLLLLVWGVFVGGQKKYFKNREVENRQDKEGRKNMKENRRGKVAVARGTRIASPFYLDGRDRTFYEEKEGRKDAECAVWPEELFSAQSYFGIFSTLWVLERGSP